MIYYLFKGIRILALLFSFYGLFQLAMEKCRLRKEFLLSFIFSGIGMIIFFAGILNIMEEACFAICAFGCICGVRSLVKKQKIGNVIFPAACFFAMTCAIAFLLVFKDKFVRYDNFTHWALVVRTILEKNRLPRFSDNMIVFQSYPTGSAGFIYYICHSLQGGEEWMMMLSQAMLILSYIISLFAFIRKKVTGTIILTVMTVLWLTCNVGISTLYVDTLLPLIGMAGVLICIYYQKEISGRFLYLIPYVSFLITVKNSGIFFAAIIIGCYIFYAGRAKGSVKRTAVLILAPLVTLLLWNKHVDYVFELSEYAPHNMSAGHYMQVLGEKTLEDIYAIGISYFKTVFSWSNSFVWLLLALVVSGILYKINQREGALNYKHLVWITALSYVAYEIGMLGMYIFSMPRAEALALAAYDRYHLTVLIFLTGLLTAYVLNGPAGEEKRKRWVTAAGIAVTVALQFIIVPFEPANIQRGYTSDSLRYQLETIAKEKQLEHGSSYVIIQSKEKSGYGKYLGRYLFESEQILCVNNNNLDLIQDTWQNYEYLIVVEAAEEEKEALKTMIPGYSGETVFCLAAESK